MLDNNKLFKAMVAKLIFQSLNFIRGPLLNLFDMLYMYRSKIHIAINITYILNTSCSKRLSRSPQLVSNLTYDTFNLMLLIIKISIKFIKRITCTIFIRDFYGVQYHQINFPFTMVKTSGYSQNYYQGNLQKTAL